MKTLMLLLGLLALTILTACHPRGGPNESVIERTNK